MIGDLEMTPQEPGTEDRPADLLDSESPRSGADGRAARRRALVWGLAGGIAAASAVWGVTLQAVGHGHARTPDLHGMLLLGAPCTSVDLEPLTGLVAPNALQVDTSDVNIGPAVDHADCSFVSTVPGAGASDGTETVYAVEVTVDLHKKADPRAEFTDLYGSPSTQSGFRQAEAYSIPLPTGPVTKPYPGLGDLAYLTTDVNHLSLSVLSGGAVVTLSVDYGEAATTAADTPTGLPVGWTGPPSRAHTEALRPLLPRTVRHLMSALASHSPGA
jgi:hypothetical protein